MGGFLVWLLAVRCCWVFGLLYYVTFTTIWFLLGSRVCVWVFGLPVGISGYMLVIGFD